ncbi:hypothetical protein MCEMSE6_02053 [Oxalobacteraceae bacterium]
MPKLNKVQIADRLRDRVEGLRNGKEIAARDLRALLTKEQVAAIDTAWTEQQALRKVKRARTKEEEQALGWRSKREIQIEMLEQVINQAEDQMLDTYEELRRKAELRQARIYLDSYFGARDAGKTEAEAQSSANNDLTRAGLRRVDGQVVGHTSQRDKEIWEMENQLQQQVKTQMSAEELEQIELLEEHERAWVGKLKKLK